MFYLTVFLKAAIDVNLLRAHEREQLRSVPTVESVQPADGEKEKKKKVLGA